MIERQQVHFSQYNCEAIKIYLLEYRNSLLNKFVEPLHNYIKTILYNINKIEAEKDNLIKEDEEGQLVYVDHLQVINMLDELIKMKLSMEV